MNEQETYETLLSAWNEPDKTERAKLVSNCLTDHFLYADPHNPDELTTHSDFEAFLDIFRERVPGAEVRPTGFRHHRTYALGTFEIIREGVRFTSGSYAMDYAGDGRIIRMIGFVG